MPVGANRNLFDLEAVSQSMEEHERIVDTLARRDEIAAEAAVQRHIESVRDIVAALPDEEAKPELASSF